MKATSIGELWRRWHMTLSRFLKEYLYFPLGGSRGGLTATCRNLMITMLLCGLWHGAGWNFVVWGGIHGLLLSAEHVWNRLPGRPAATSEPAAFVTFLRRVRTCLWLAVSFVFFRAETWDAAVKVLSALLGWRTPGSLPIDAFIADDIRMSAAAAWLLVGLAIVWAWPNTQQIMGRFNPALDYRYRPGRETWLGRLRTRLQWRPHWSHALASALLLGIAISAMSKAEEFLYFRF
ncbi:MAG: MBOAT family O-acyltransferase [Planctomycetaceae bacterium]